MLSNLKISQKVLLQGAIQLVLLVIMASVATSQMAKLGTEIFEIAEEDIPLMRMLTRATEHQLEQAIYLERMFFKAALVQQKYTAAQLEMEKNIAKVSEYQANVQIEINDAKDFAQAAMTKLHTPAAKQEYRNIVMGLDSVLSDLMQLEAKTIGVIEAARDGDMSVLINQAKTLEQLEDKVDADLIAILDVIQNFTQNSALRAEAHEEFAIKLIIGQFVIALAVAIATPIIIGNSIVSPINKLKNRLNEVAAGDGNLTLRLKDDGRDEVAEVAQSFNRFLVVLNKVIKNVSGQADELGSSAETGLRVMEITLKNVVKQQSETEQVATAVEEMSSNTAEIAKTTNDASQVAEVVRNKVREGQDIALSTQKIIEHLAVEVEQAADVIEGLMAETNNIGQVTDTIQSIAEQTNLLALNAAIEAARAGESGRGFAVVADEVRSLAQRTRESTVDIQDLVQRLQEQATKAVDSMARGKSSTMQCLEKGVETAIAFDAASEAVNEISDLNTQIASSSQQQATVSQQVNESLVNITQLAEETSEGARDTSAANENIAKRLIDLHANINIFQTS